MHELLLKDYSQLLEDSNKHYREIYATENNEINYAADSNQYLFMSIGCMLVALFIECLKSFFSWIIIWAILLILAICFLIQHVRYRKKNSQIINEHRYIKGKLEHRKDNLVALLNKYCYETVSDYKLLINELEAIEQSGSNTSAMNVLGTAFQSCVFPVAIVFIDKFADKHSVIDTVALGTVVSISAVELLLVIEAIALFRNKDSLNIQRLKMDLLYLIHEGKSR